MLAALLAQATVEQIAPPQSPAAAIRVEQTRPPSDKHVAITQLPPTPLAVEQPEPRMRPHQRSDGDDAAADAARTYAAILGGAGVAASASKDLTGRTISEAAAAASLSSAAGKTPSATPGVPGVPTRGQ